jgi:hypothetical protein
MRTAQSAVLTLIVWMLCCTSSAVAQTNPAGVTAAPKKPAAKKGPSKDEQIASLKNDVQGYQTAMLQEDVKSHPELLAKVTDELISATCHLEALQLPPTLTQDPKFLDGLLSACSDRLHRFYDQKNGSPSGSAPAPAGNAGGIAPPASTSACVINEQAAVSGADTKYSYAMHCAKDAKPNEIALSMTSVKPALTAAEIEELVQNFASALGSKAPSYDSAKNMAVFSVPMGGSPYAHSFDFSSPTAPTSSIFVVYYIASGAVTDATLCESNLSNPGCSTGPIAVPISNPVAATAAKCSADDRYGSVEVPVLNAVNPGADSTAVSGKIAATANGRVQLCSKGKPLGQPLPVSKGEFSVTFDSKSSFKLTNGQTIQAQFINQQNEWSEPTKDLVVGSCKMAGGNGTGPTLSVTPGDNNKATFSGTVKEGADKTNFVRVCVNDLPTVPPTPPVGIGTGGKFSGRDLPLKAGDMVTAQACNGSVAGCVDAFGPVSDVVPITSVGLQAGNATPSGGPVSILIGGVEYGGYSSEAQTTDGFLNIFYRGLRSKSTGFAGWTRIRLTSAAQPATNGVVSVIANPTGLTTYNFSNVGQVFDYVVGPSWNIPKTQYWALIAGLGAITPLSSQSAPVVFVAPPPGTTECTTLLSRFSPKNGYNPGLTPNTVTNPPTCVVNGMTGVTNIAFTNQDRSNFLLKYGAGVRTWYPLGSCKAGGSAGNCSPTYAAADITLGQDESVTGGVLRGVVFKMDGLLPIPTGSASWLYLFGSAYIRFNRNTNLPPLLLASPTTSVTVPAPTVAVLPLVQPNRDYYRLGVGLNINQLWCKVYASSCPTTAQDSNTKNAAPSISGLNPPSAKAGSAKDLSLTVTGSNFAPDSKINWDGTALAGTQFVSDTELSVTVPKANLAKVTTVKVTVVNPSPAGASAARDFQIQ